MITNRTAEIMAVQISTVHQLQQWDITTRIQYFHWFFILCVNNGQTTQRCKGKTQRAWLSNKPTFFLKKEMSVKMKNYIKHTTK
jgi:hypothetical protein